MAQQVDKLNAGDTALRFLPMGAIGFVASMGTGKLLEYVNGKYTLLAGLTLTVVAPIPSSLTATNPEPNLYILSFLHITGKQKLTSIQLGQRSPHIPHQHYCCIPDFRNHQHPHPNHRPGQRQKPLRWNAQHGIPNRLRSRSCHLRRGHRCSRHPKRPQCRTAVLDWSVVLNWSCWSRLAHRVLLG